MKTFRFFGMLLLSMCLSFGMVACGGSDKDDEGGDIVGSWYNYYTEDGYQYYEIYTFGSNGILSYAVLASMDGKTWYKNEDYESVQYSVKGSTVYVGGEGSSYSVNGNQLTLDGEVLYKVTSDIQKIWNSATPI